jgi:hypothetical protein
VGDGCLTEFPFVAPGHRYLDAASNQSDKSVCDSAIVKVSALALTEHHLCVATPGTFESCQSLIGTCVEPDDRAVRPEIPSDALPRTSEIGKVAWSNRRGGPLCVGGYRVKEATFPRPLICCDFSSSPTPLAQLHIPEVLAAFETHFSECAPCAPIPPAIVQNLACGLMPKPRADQYRNQRLAAACAASPLVFAKHLRP